MNAATASRLVAAALLAVLGTALGAAGPRPLHAQGLGVAAGLGFADQQDIEAGSADATFENALGYHFGVTYEVGGGPLSFRSGLLYHRIGSYDFPAGEELELAALELPLEFLLELFSLPSLSSYLVVGPVLTIPRESDGLEDATRSLSMTADAGLGVEISVPGGLRLLPELRYSIGVADYLAESFEVGGVTVRPSEEERRLSRVTLRLHLMF